MVPCDVRNRRIDDSLTFFQEYPKRRHRLSALAPEMDCDQTAMGLPPVTSAVFLIAKSF
jgi:hypothetical protein